MARTKISPSDKTPCLFGSHFMQDHAGQIIEDPKVAIIEMLANSYDAGASSVCVQWPTQVGDLLSVTDDGTGLTRSEFDTRWRTLKYERPRNQGRDVCFPPEVSRSRRTAFGHNGKGRFSPFCFADDYRVETWKDGICTEATVTLTEGGETPFVCKVERESKRGGHGTCVSVVAHRGILPAYFIRELIGFKFAVDPGFSVMVNGEPVKLFDLGKINSRKVPVNGIGDVLLHRIDPVAQERTKQLKGIAWWVNQRMVGEPSWEGLDAEGKYLDGRTSEAKRFSFVVEADMLQGDDMQPDWSGFRHNDRVEQVRAAVHKAVIEDLKELFADDRKEVKKQAIQQNRYVIRNLPLVSQRQIGAFLDEVQDRCPSLKPADLTRTVEIWGRLEQSRGGYDLLRQLSACSPADLDTWNSLMQRWTATNAETILSELGRRITLIRQLQQLVHRNCDEVHDLQPLFEQGLWIFGPEYESIEFTSNRGMNHVVTEFFGRKGITASRHRPDFIALPDSSIGLYSSDHFKEGEVIGVDKVLIVELKKGNLEIGSEQLYQADGYAKELRKTGCAQEYTRIEGFVLGGSVENGLQELSAGGQTTIRPMTFDIVLKRAHARVFNLTKKLQETQPTVAPDKDIEEVLSEQTFEDLFDAQANETETGQ
jgi:histidine kinase/DNA gyrase B/HSP90-like ATPase